MVRALLDGDDGTIGPRRVLLDGQIGAGTLGTGDVDTTGAHTLAQVLTGVWPDGELRLHERTGYDEEGSPVFDWTVVASGLVALNVKTVDGVEAGTAMMETTAGQSVTDDAVLFIPTLGRFEITKVIARFVERVELEVRRAR